MNIISGEEVPDSGHVAFTPAGLCVGYLHQGITFDITETMGSYLNRHAINLDETLALLEEVCGKLSINPDEPGLVAV